MLVNFPSGILCSDFQGFHDKTEYFRNKTTFQVDMQPVLLQLLSTLVQNGLTHSVLTCSFQTCRIISEPVPVHCIGACSMLFLNRKYYPRKSILSPSISLSIYLGIFRVSRIHNREYGEQSSTTGNIKVNLSLYDLEIEASPSQLARAIFVQRRQKHTNF